MRHLGPLDAQFVDAEDSEAQTSMAIASIAIFEGPPPGYDEFLTAIAGRLADVPIYRRKLRRVPLRLGPPVWSDDPHFDLRYHVRHTALPAPGGDTELSSLMARVMGQRLDRDYPLWEYWLVEGLRDNQWALISKVHHAMVDGVAGTDLYRVIFDATPEPTPPGAPPADEAARPPSSLALAVQAGLDLMVLPAKSALAIRGALARPAATVRQLASTAQAAAKLATVARPAPASSLNGPIGRQRRYAWARAALADIKLIKNELGGTVNDVVLAAITSAYRELLLSRGEEPVARMVPSLVPVSLRAPGEEGGFENLISVLVAELPVEVADPAERLARVSAEMAGLKSAREALAAEALVAVGRYTPYPLASLVVRLGYRLPQREVVTVTTNVPGPRQPIYSLGRRLIEIIPYVPIATSLRSGVSIFSYCDRVTFGVTADYASVPDIALLAEGIEKGIAELLAIAGVAGHQAS